MLGLRSEGRSASGPHGFERWSDGPTRLLYDCTRTRREEREEPRPERRTCL